MIRNKYILTALCAFVMSMAAATVAMSESATVLNPANRPSHTATLPLFTNQSTTGVAGTVYDIGFLAAEHTLAYTFTGSPTSVLVIMQGTIDGTNWFNLREFVGTSNTMEHIVNRPIRKIRGYLTTLDAGSVTVRSIHGGI
jgi:hypothetical protein